MLPANGAMASVMALWLYQHCMRACVHLHSLHMMQVQAVTCRPLIQWYIMTSSATDAETRAFFEKAKYFSLEESQVMFFQQVSGLLSLGKHAFQSGSLCNRAGHSEPGKTCRPSALYDGNFGAYILLIFA